MPVRSRRTRTAREPHPTAVQLLDSAIALLETTPLDDVNIAMVLEHSGVSHGSLYHHFEDFGDLIEQALVHLYERGFKESLGAITAMLECTDAADFRARVDELIIQRHAPERRELRMSRVEVIGLSKHRPRLAERLAIAHQHQLDAQRDLYAEFQRRGWLRADVDPMALSAFTAGVNLGPIVDDIAQRPVGPEKWNQVVLLALHAALFGD